MRSPVTITIEAHRFSARDAIAGDPSLDFVNTVSGRDQKPRDWLDSYARLLEWAALVQIVPARLLRALALRAQREPDEAQIALARAKQLREGLFDLLTAVIAARAPSKRARELLREHWVAGINAHELRFRDARVVPELNPNGADLGLISSMVGYGMVERVLTIPSDRLCICQGANCAWLFIDRSKAGRRRWCDMGVCGNRAKSQRFQARLRREPAL
jgi:predicted RNA-binding Zn ribbon-like protein